jgi:hypothetical protein
VDSKTSYVAVVKNGVWTAKHHMLLDTLYDNGGQINVKTLRQRYPYLKKWRAYQIERWIEDISNFDFIAMKDNRMIIGPILRYEDGKIHFKHKLNKKVTIPHHLYMLNGNAQFLYRRYFVYKKKGSMVNIHLETFVEYLSLTAEKRHSRRRINGYLAELKNSKLINRFSEKCQSKTRFYFITK